MPDRGAGTCPAVHVQPLAVAFSLAVQPQTARADE